MANVVNDAVDLMRRVGSGVKRNLVRSNGGMGTIQSKRVAKLHDLESSIYKGMKEKTGEELADFLDNHRPSNYRVGKNYKTWQGMTEKSKKAAITGDLQIRSRNADRVADAIRTANHTKAGTKETFNLMEINQKVYAKKSDFIDLDVPVLRQGILVGEIIKNRFEPHQHFYSASILKDQFLKSVELDEKQTELFLSGNVVEYPIKGYVCVKYKGIPYSTYL